LARSLQDLYGYSRSPVTLFTDKANEIRKLTGVAGPAFNPFCYADKLGIVVEEKAGMALDGVLRKTESGRFVVWLNKRASRRRKNFTLAHEISHTFFYEILHHRRNPHRIDGVDEEEERLCDIGATELLMPATNFRMDAAAAGDVTPETLFNLIKAYDVSLEAVASRLVQLLQVAYIIWEKSDGTIIPKQVRPYFMKRVLLCETGRSSVERAFTTPGKLFIGNDSFYGIKEKSRIRRRTSSMGLVGNRSISIIPNIADLYAYSSPDV